jgi:hypothetical protein
MKKITMMKSYKNMEKMKEIEFAQIYKGILSLPVIKNRNDNKTHLREIKIEENTSKYEMRVNFLAPRLDVHNLKVLILLFANTKINKENLEILEALENPDLVERLNFKLEPNKKNSYRKIIRYRISLKELLLQLGLKPHPDNINNLKETLELLQSLLVDLTAKNRESNEIELHLTSKLLIVQTENQNKRGNKITLILNPLFYLVTFVKKNTVLKSTVNLQVFQKLFEINSNMPIVYSKLCDEIDFGKEKEFSIEELELACYGNIAEDKSTKSRRKKFLLNSLREIEKLSNRSFIIKIDEEKIKVKRIPDREKVEGKFRKNREIIQKS